MSRLGRPIIVIELSKEEREQLEEVVRRRRAAKADVQRAKVVLLSAEGITGKEIARRVGLSEPTVGKWRQRFLTHRCLGLSELPRSGAPRRVSDEQIEEIIRQTLESAPTAATHWSTREMAKRCGFSRQTVSRIWRTFGLQPHRSENFTLSTDPYFVDKVRDVVGLYLDPPANALVLCVDEKTQVQALERSQPVLPMRPGQPERRTHDYYRHGTLSLFYVIDRGYMDFKRLNLIVRAGAFFVTRAKDNLRFSRQHSFPVDQSTGLRSDQIGNATLSEDPQSGMR